jgi:hypothetical protein
MSFLLPYQVCVPNFSLFDSIELILTQDATSVAHSALPVAWSTNLRFYVVSIACQVCVPSFSSFGPIELILTQAATLMTHPALPVAWSTNFIYHVISIAISSMCTKFQLIWSNRTHSDPRCYFCGTSRTSSCLVHKLKFYVTSIVLTDLRVEFQLIDPNKTF